MTSKRSTAWGETEIASLLEAYVDSERAAAMANAVWHDMRAVNFDLFASNFNPPGMWDEIGAIRQAEYVVPPNQFDINSPIGSEAMEGSFLTCGNLLRLAQCAILAREYIPNLWPSAFGKRIRNGREHLDALNEIWWLKFWRGITNVVPGPKVHGNAPDFDWQISIMDGLSTCTINLEVKRRTGNINSFFKKSRPDASLSKIAKKFGLVPDGVANVAALTLYHNIPEDVDRAVRSWFAGQPHLHGLLIWTEGAFQQAPLRKYFKETHRWAGCLVRDAEAEDLKIAARANGTLSDVADIPKLIERLSRTHWGPTIHRPW